MHSDTRPRVSHMAHSALYQATIAPLQKQKPCISQTHTHTVACAGSYSPFGANMPKRAALQLLLGHFLMAVGVCLLASPGLANVATGPLVA